MSFASVVAITIISSVQANTIYVDDDASLGGDGQSWTTAFRFLQDAIANATDGTEIRVARGIYRPDQDEGGNVTPGDRRATFQLMNGVTFMGGYAGIGELDPDARDIALTQTSLSGDLLGDDGPNFDNYDENSYHVVSGRHTGTATIDGLVITGGNADAVFDGSCLTGEAHGGGLVVCSGDLLATRCTFIGNRARSGGGVSVFGQLSDNTLFVNCIFVGNDAFQGAGGGLSRIGGHPRLVNCLFANNIATNGGAIFVNFSSGMVVLDLINCTVVGNETHFGEGGGIAIQGGADITNCVLWANENDQVDVSIPDAVAVVSYSCVQGGWPGAGNIEADPLFVLPPHNLRLLPGSPCIDAGDNAAVPTGITSVLGGDPRFADDPDSPDCQQAPGTCGGSPVVDMGAYETPPEGGLFSCSAEETCVLAAAGAIPYAYPFQAASIAQGFTCGAEEFFVEGDRVGGAISLTLAVSSLTIAVLQHIPPTAPFAAIASPILAAVACVEAELEENIEEDGFVQGVLETFISLGSESLTWVLFLGSPVNILMEDGSGETLRIVDGEVVSIPEHGGWVYRFGPDPKEQLAVFMGAQLPVNFTVELDSSVRVGDFDLRMVVFDDVGNSITAIYPETGLAGSGTATQTVLQVSAADVPLLDIDADGDGIIDYTVEPIFVQIRMGCPWDFDGDGNVGITDLLLLVGDFGSCDGSPADFDGDGCVTFVDLLTLLLNFGPCPDGRCPWDVTGDGTVDLNDLWQVLTNLGPCDGCPEDINSDGVVDGQDVFAVITHLGPCP